jgi:hypothetical protein
LDGSTTVIRARDIAVMNADLGSVTGRRQFPEEFLRVLAVPAVPSGHRSALADQAPTDRRPDSTGTTRYEGNAPTELVSPTRLRPGFTDLLNRSRRHNGPLSVISP